MVNSKYYNINIYFYDDLEINYTYLKFKIYNYLGSKGFMVDHILNTEDSILKCGCFASTNLHIKELFGERLQVLFDEFQEIYDAECY